MQKRLVAFAGISGAIAVITGAMCAHLLKSKMEAGLISQRTKAALKAAKARGKRLGNPQNATREGALKGCQLGRRAQEARARARAHDLEPVLNEIQSQGLTTLTAIALAFNDRNIPTARGCRWQAKSVQRLLEHLAA